MKHHGLLYSIMVLCASNIGLQGLGFIYRIGVSRLAGAEGLGLYHLAYSVYAVVHAACLSGITMACSRLSAELYASGHRNSIGLMTKKAAKTFVLFISLGASILFIFRDFIAQNILGDLSIKTVFPIMIICLALTGVENIVKSICIGLDKVEWAASAELTEQIIRIGSVLGLLAVFGGEDTGKVAIIIFVGMCLSECVSAALLARIYKSRIYKPIIKPLPNGFNKEFISVVLPLTGAAIFNNILASASSIILPKRLMLAGLTEQQALYQLGVISSMAMPLLLLPIAMVGSMCTVIMPAISKSRTQGNNNRINSLVEKAIGITGLLAIPLTALIVPLAPTLSRLFFAEQITLSYMAMLGVEVVLIYYQMVTTGILNGLGKQRFVVFSAVAGEILQLVLVWILAANPKLRIYGYIIAQAMASILTVGCNFICLCTCTDIKQKLFSLFAKPLVCGATVFLWVRILYTFFLGAVGFQWLSVVFTVLSSGGICVFLLNILGVKLSDYIKTGKSSNMSFIWSLY